MAQVDVLTEAEAEPRAAAGRPHRRGGAWGWDSLAVVAMVAAGLRLWRLDQNGFGNGYYAAAVRSMLASWSNFFFGSFDPLGFVTVDKPPVALWIQAASAWLLGFHGWSILLPQAMMGVASVVLVYHLVRRVFGAGAGLLAALILAITPIGVAMDRDNLPDPALVLILLLAAWALTRAVETGRLGPLLVSTALVGLGFETKMLAAFVVLPTFYLVYLLAAPIGRRLRLAHLAIATAVLVATSLAWPIAVELTPKSRRPYIGGSANNSAMELALGYNGLARVMGMGGRFGPPGPRGPFAGPPPADGARPGDPANAAEPKDAGPDEADAEAFPPPPPGGPGGFPPGGPGGPGGMPGFGGQPGLLRFTLPLMAGQITWLFPLAIIGTIAAAIRAPRRWPLGTEHAAILLWSGWFATHWVVFSFARGIFHEYYTYVMGAPVAAMAAIGTLALLGESRASGWRSLLLPATLMLTAAWQAFVVSRSPDWGRWLMPIVLGGASLGAAGLLTGRWLSARWGDIPWARSAVALGLFSLLIAPAAWSMTPVLAKGTSMMPTADPSLVTGRGGPGGMPMGPPPFEMDARGTEKLIAFLRANHHNERILLAAPGSMEVSSIIAETGDPVISLGGFMGGDPVIPKEEFVRMVEDGELRFVLIGPGPGGGGFGPPGGRRRGRAGPPGGFGPPGGGPPGLASNAELMAWVREHGKPVDPELWKVEEPPLPEDDEAEAATEPDDDPPPMPPGPGMFRRMRRMIRLYDCKPELGLAAPGKP